jgi:RND family efflux transporter MFP subunit
VQSAQLNVTKAQNALLDAQNALADYTIRAPFAGTIAKVDVKKGDQASSGTSAATIITASQIAELALNEVDAAKVKIRQKARLTFDAIDDLSIDGSVASVDTLGTVSQGVVSYNVKIDFTTRDARVKPGMTVNADIEIGSASGLVIPASAIKSQNGQRYVLAFDPPFQATPGRSTEVVTERVPKQIPIETGLSDDTVTQILSGLTEGMQIVVRQSNGTTQIQQAPSLFGNPGARQGGSGAVRIAR